MAQLVDIHGIPFDLEQISAFRVIPREAIYYPAYQETQEMKSSLFARFGSQDKKKFTFVNLVPFGILLEAKERPHIGDYKVESFSEAAGQSILSGVGDFLTGAGNLIADAFQIDTSGNMKLRILTTGRRVVEMRLRDLPAKVCLLSGKVSDVYKNDPIYPFLGEPISPTINRTKALMIKAGRETYAFFGNGIDLTDQQIDETYHALLESYNLLQQQKEEKKKLNVGRPLIQLPKIEMPKINIPFLGIKIGGEQAETEKVESSDSTSEALPDNSKQP